MKLKFNVRLDGKGRFTPIDKYFPQIKEGSEAELVVLSEDIDDEVFMLRRMDAIEHQIDVSEGVAIRLNSTTMEIPSSYLLPGMPAGSPFAKIELSGPLRVRRMLGQDPTLPNQDVHITDLDLDVNSLNQACTRLSEKFETKRTTHSYSAFEVVFVRKGQTWRPLKELI